MNGLDTRLLADHRLEALKLVVLNVDEKEAGRVGGKLLLNLMLHVALDQCNSSKRRETKTSRQQQQGRWCTRSMQIADTQADRRPPHPG